MIALAVAWGSDCDVPLPPVADRGPFREEQVLADFRGYGDDLVSTARFGDRWVGTLAGGAVVVGDTRYGTPLERGYELAVSSCCVVVEDSGQVWSLDVESGEVSTFRVHSAGEGLSVDGTGRIAVRGWVFEGGESRQLYGPRSTDALTWGGDGVLYGLVGNQAARWPDLDGMPELRTLDLPDTPYSTVRGVFDRFVAVELDEGGAVFDLRSGERTLTWSGVLGDLLVGPDGRSLLADDSTGLVRVTPAGRAFLGPGELTWMVGPAPDDAVTVSDGRVVSVPERGVPAIDPPAPALQAVDGVVEVDGHWLSAPGTEGRLAVQVGDVVALVERGSVVGIDPETGAERWRHGDPDGDRIEVLQELDGYLLYGRNGYSGRLLDTRGSEVGYVGELAYGPQVAAVVDGTQVVAGDDLDFGGRHIELPYGMGVRWLVERDGGAEIGFFDGHVEWRTAEGDVGSVEGASLQKLAWLPTGNLAIGGMEGLVLELDPSGEPVSARVPAAQHVMRLAQRAGVVVSAHGDGSLAVGCGVAETDGVYALAGGERLAASGVEGVVVDGVPWWEEYGSPQGLAWSPDGRTLAVQAGSSLILLNGRTTREIPMGAYPEDVGWWSGRLVIPDGEGVYAHVKKKRWKAVVSTTAPILRMAVRGEHLATATTSGDVQVWAPDGTEVWNRVVPAEVFDLEWSEGGRLAGSFADGTVRVWEADGTLAWVVSLVSGELVRFR
ncbi:MAG: hypothetical protein R3F61_23760 [Myxococcota bacterium]